MTYSKCDGAAESQRGQYFPKFSEVYLVHLTRRNPKYPWPDGKGDAPLPGNTGRQGSMGEAPQTGKVGGAGEAPLPYTQYYAFDYFDQLFCVNMNVHKPKVREDGRTGGYEGGSENSSAVGSAIRPYMYFSGQAEQSEPFAEPGFPPLSHLLLTLAEIDGAEYALDAGAGSGGGHGKAAGLSDPYRGGGSEPIGPSVPSGGSNGKVADPFDPGDDTMPFFSLILVNKKPDVPGNDGLPPNAYGSGGFAAWKKSFDEIKKILNRILNSEENIRPKTLLKILYPMNAGDFIIAVRSDRVEAAYRIAIDIRQKGGNHYETFTTSAFSTNSLPKLIAGGQASSTQFAVRLKVEDHRAITVLKSAIDEYNRKVARPGNGSGIAESVSAKGDADGAVAAPDKGGADGAAAASAKGATDGAAAASAKGAADGAATASAKGGAMISPNIGLYGRYDMSVILPQDQFFRLFAKLHIARGIDTADTEIGGNVGGAGGATGTDTADTNIGSSTGGAGGADAIGDAATYAGEELSDCIAALITDAKHRVSTINIRPLLDMGDVSDAGGTACGTAALTADPICAQTIYLQERLTRLLSERHRIVFNVSEYRLALNLLNDIHKTYSGIFFESDSFVNGQIFFAQMLSTINTLTECLEYLDRLKDPDGSPGNNSHSIELFSRELIQWLRMAVVCINSFSKLAVSVNLQSIQSPNFEMQARVDMEKYVIAYSEFLRKFSSDYYAHYTGPRSPTKLGFRVFPIVTAAQSESHIAAYSMSIPSVPEPSYAMVGPAGAASPTGAEAGTMTGGAASGTDSAGAGAGHAGATTASGAATASVAAEHAGPAPVRFVPIFLPSVDYFHLPYETLPLISHEISHNFRFVPREERNKELSRYIMENIAAYLLKSWMNSDNADDTDKEHWSFILKYAASDVADVLYCAFENSVPIGQLDASSLAERIPAFMGTVLRSHRSHDIKALADGIRKLYAGYYRLCATRDEDVESLLEAFDGTATQIADAIDKSGPVVTQLGISSKIFVSSAISKEFSGIFHEINQILKVHKENIRLKLPIDRCQKMHKTILTLLSDINEALLELAKFLPYWFEHISASNPTTQDTSYPSSGSVYRQASVALDGLRRDVDKLNEALHVIAGTLNPPPAATSPTGYEESLENVCLRVRDFWNFITDRINTLESIHLRHRQCQILTKKCKAETHEAIMPSEPRRDWLLRQIYERLLDRKRNLEPGSGNVSGAYETLFKSGGWTAAWVRLGLLYTEDMFKDNFGEFLDNNYDIARLSSEKISIGYAKLYKEVFADLCMCAAMGFNAFGYFNFIVKRYNIGNIGEIEILGKNMMYPRTALVMGTLIRQELEYGNTRIDAGDGGTDHDDAYRICEHENYRNYLEKLDGHLKNADTYVRNGCNKILQRLPDADNAPNACAGLKNALKHLEGLLSDSNKDAISEPSKILEAADQALFACGMSQTQKKPSGNATSGNFSDNIHTALYEQISHFRAMLQAKSGVKDKFNHCKRRIFSHISDIFMEHIASPRREPSGCAENGSAGNAQARNHAGCRWECNISPIDIELRNHIAGYYNSPGFKHYDKELSCDIFKENLHFITHHYLNSRMLYECSLSSLAGTRGNDSNVGNKVPICDDTASGWLGQIASFPNQPCHGAPGLGGATR